MPSQAQVIELLRGIDLFADLSRKELSTIANCLRPLEHEDGEEIVTEGDGDGRFFIVMDGTAIASAHGKRLATFGPGQYFGEISLMDGGPRTATVVAETNLTTLALSRKDFSALLQSEPKVTVGLLKHASALLRRLERPAAG